MPVEPQVRPDEVAIVLIDVQTSFLEAAGDPGPVLLRLERLLMFAQMLDLPVVATFERPPEQKGRLPPRLEKVMPPETLRFEKSTFDCMSEETIAAAIAGLGRRTLAVAGAETDVCVLLSVLGMLDAGYRVMLLTDCVFTSEPDPSAALRRMEQAGAVPTTFKTLAYELTATVDRTTWPPSWREKEHLFPPTESLPGSEVSHRSFS